MIPTVIFVGAIFRRWWIALVAAILWPVVVVVWGDIDTVGGFLGAGLLGAINAAFGAIIGTAIEKLAGGLWTAANARSR